MKKLLTVVTAFFLCLVFSSIGNAQFTFDTANFTISAQIKPSDYKVWNDSVAAWRVYADYDLDKDGKKEFLVIVDAATTQPSDTSMPMILRFEANGNNKYDLVWSTTIPYQGGTKGSWPCLTVADLDKDGKQEIIFGLPLDALTSSNPDPERIFIYEYDPDSSNFLSEPTLTSRLSFPSNYYYAITSIVANDVDNDNDIELVLSARRAYGGGSGSSSTRPLFIYHLTGDISPGFNSFEMEFADSIGTFNGGYYHNNHVVDFDKDGKKEIWGFTWDLLSYAVYEATGKDTYVLQTDVNQVATADYGEQHSVGFYDANKDGKLEMYVAGQANPPSAIFYLPNTTDVSTLTTTSTKMLTPELTVNFQGATIGDIDNNGEVDFIIGDWGSDRKVYRLQHLAGKPFDEASGYKLDTLFHAPFDSTYELPNVAIANDLDGDGKRELFIVNTNTRANKPNDASIIILESKVVVLSVQQISSTIPLQFTLEQNFPNPFNPSSTIRFSVKTEGPVELFITNALGQKVSTLLNGNITPGTHEVKFNADGLSSGTYFYTLKSGNYTETKKMMFVK